MRSDEKKTKNSFKKNSWSFLFMGVSSQRKMKYNFPFVFLFFATNKE
jgi:hypothetical protein